MNIYKLYKNIGIFQDIMHKYILEIYNQIYWVFEWFTFRTKPALGQYEEKKKYDEESQTNEETKMYDKDLQSDEETKKYDEESQTDETFLLS